MAYWDFLERAHCYLQNSCSCEPMSRGLIEQPMATITSLGWVIMGVSLLIRSMNPTLSAPSLQISPLVYDRFYQRFSGAIFFVMGMSSVACHATFTHIGFFLDFGAIPTLMNFTAGYCFSTLTPSPRRGRLAAYCLGLSIPQSILVWFYIDHVKYLMMAISMTALITLMIVRLRQKTQGRPIYLLSAAFFLSIGATVFSLDLMRPYCWPITFVHSHTVWHVLATLGTFFSYQYFESEKFNSLVVKQPE